MTDPQRPKCPKCGWDVCTERLRESQAAELANWSDLYVNLGRAAEAADRGATADVRHWLREAEACEYELLGNCEQTAEVLEALEAEVMRGGDP